MTKPFRLQPLLDLANDRLDEAARILGELISGEGECQRKLEALEAYRAAYQARFQEAASKGMGPDAWRNFAASLSRRHQAVQARRMQRDEQRLSDEHAAKAYRERDPGGDA